MNHVKFFSALSLAILAPACGAPDAPGVSSGTGGGHGGTAPASTTTGGAGCGAGKKECGGDCVSIDDPVTSCGAESCDPCPTPHAVAQCANQQCAVAQCVGSWRDCDHTQENGCESESTSDQHNCGSCGHECVAPGATLGACLNGACSLGKCDQGHSNCDGSPANGCEIDRLNDDANCGYCGHACGSGETCDFGNCETCGVHDNDSDPGAMTEDPPSQASWTAFRFTQKYNADNAKSCVYLGASNVAAVRLLYIFDDVNGLPGSALTKASLPLGTLAAGEHCFNTTNFGVPVKLKAGESYWIAVDDAVLSGPIPGTPHSMAQSHYGPPASFNWFALNPFVAAFRNEATCN